MVDEGTLRFRGDPIHPTSDVGAGGENPFAGFEGETRATVDCGDD